MVMKLCPAQQRAFDRLMYLSTISNLFVLSGSVGLGKTEILREVHRELGGAFLNMKNFVDAIKSRHPYALEETFEQMVMEALIAHDFVFVDDLHLITNVASCNFYYQRGSFMNAPLTTLGTYAVEAGKRLFFGVDHSAPAPINQRAFYTNIKDFKPTDYQYICNQYLDANAASVLNYEKIYRFAPKLNAHQIKGACIWLKREKDLDTDQFIDYLQSQRLTSNVDLGEVREADLRDLRGVDDIIQSLEANIILPLENDELATELNLKPKRGVLLAGPPGTGKTTIGRALAHRLKSKFFMIDGTFISGTSNFYGRIHEVFEAAKQNAPSIIFIDDSDAIFESGEELGLYRYLLTMLDGLESESAERVCVIMTAMNVANLPPALIRSGRVELWLEMRLPDNEARAIILSSGLSELPEFLSDADLPRLVVATEGFTGADLKRLIEDGKNLFAYDRANNRPLRSTTEYYLSAVGAVRANKERYAEAEANSRQQRATRQGSGILVGNY